MTAVAHDCMTQHQTFAPGAVTHGSGVLERLARTFAVWRARRRERRSFVDLDYRELRELGLSRWEVERQLAKPFWRS